MMKAMILAGLTAALLCGGCWFMSEPANDAVATYDLAVPKVRTASCDFARIRNLTPGGMKMLFRKPGGLIWEDPSLCWVQMPETMLARYLQSAFPPAKEPCVRLTLLRFDLDLERALAVLTVDLAVEHGAKRTVKRCEFTAPLKSGGAAAAAAMSVCAAQLTETISKTLQEK